MSKSKGTVKFFNISKGFGFIQPSDGSKDVFIHVSNLSQDLNGTLDEGQSVLFDTQEGKKGMEAVNVESE